MYLEIQCVFQKIGNRENVKIIAIGKMLTTYENFKDICKHICVYIYAYIHEYKTVHLSLPIFVCSTNTSSVSGAILTFYYINLLLFVRIL